MQSIRQRLRPKHQVLILKCYPRLSKNSAVAEVKPNGSELSYLLYYASSRRSKLSKVGTFLEQRTATDLNKARTTSVQVSLLILTAFLNNPAIGGAGPAGFDLFAPFVLRILHNILQRPTEAILVEDALATWAVFCTRQDHVLLSADSEYRGLFTSVVQLWAGFANKVSPDHRKRGLLPLRGAKLGHGIGDAIRLRTAGLQALKSLSDSDTLGPEAGQQLDILIPVLCQTLQGHEGNLTTLLDLLQQTELQDKALAAKSRPSMAPSRHTTESVDPRAAEGTAADADRLADQEADIIAMQCLKSICMVENRLQIRAAVLAALAHITKSDLPSSNHASTHETWSVKLFETICGWIPVQDRFVALFCAVQTLVGGLVKTNEDYRVNLSRHLLLSRLVAHVLGSDINFIGLSVMDIMLGLLQSLIRIAKLRHAATTSTDADTTSMQEADLLLPRLHLCITNLAVHVYYTDQISDMVSALLATTTNDSPTTTNLFTISPDRDSPLEASSDASLKTRTDSNGNGPVASAYARQVVLDVVKDVITVANTDARSGYVADNRNNVPVSVWEGTQWLLRDPCPAVRQSYVAALVSWLSLELRKSDANPEQEHEVPPRKTRSDASDGTSRSQTVNLNKTRTNHVRFLQSLHVAVYDNAISLLGMPNGQQDLLLLHLLLFTMAKSLGFNAVRISLPMCMAVQQNTSTLPPKAATQAGNLFYAYLLTLCHIFGVNYPAIRTEVERRKSIGVWTSNLEVPALSVKSIQDTRSPSVSKAELSATETLIPFGDRKEFVRLLVRAYSRPSHSPSTSNTSNSARPQLIPALTTESMSTTVQSRRLSNELDELPQPIIEDLSTVWSRDTALAELNSDLRTGSFSSFNGLASRGAKSRPASTVFKDYLVANWDHRQFLGAMTGPGARLRPHSLDRSLKANPLTDSVQANGRARPTSYGPQIITNQFRMSQSPERGGFDQSASPTYLRRSADSRGSGMGPFHTPPSPVKVEDLKRVLATGTGPQSVYDDNDTDSESMLYVDESFGEFDYDDEDPALDAEQSDVRDFASRGASDTPPQDHVFHVRKTRAVEHEEKSPKDMHFDPKITDTEDQLPVAVPIDSTAAHDPPPSHTPQPATSDLATQDPSAAARAPALLTNHDASAVQTRNHTSLAPRASADGIRASSRLSTSSTAGDRLSRASSQGTMSRRHLSAASRTSSTTRRRAGAGGGSIRVGSNSATGAGPGSGSAAASMHRRQVFSGLVDGFPATYSSGASASAAGNLTPSFASGSARSSSANLVNLLATVKVDGDGDGGSEGNGEGDGDGRAAGLGADHAIGRKNSLLEIMSPPY